MSSPKVGPPIMPLIGMYVSACAQEAEQYRAREMRERESKKQMQFADFLRSEEQRRKIVLSAPASGKCQGCGSRHFVKHEGRRICSYCRGEQ